jgi:hypothetical protein
MSETWLVITRESVSPSHRRRWPRGSPISRPGYGRQTDGEHRRGDDEPRHDEHFEQRAGWCIRHARSVPRALETLALHQPLRQIEEQSHEGHGAQQRRADDNRPAPRDVPHGSPGYREASQPGDHHDGGQDESEFRRLVVEGGEGQAEVAQGEEPDEDPTQADMASACLDRTAALLR